MYLYKPIYTLWEKASTKTKTKLALRTAEQRRHMRRQPGSSRQQVPARERGRGSWDVNSMAASTFQQRMAQREIAGKAT